MIQTALTLALLVGAGLLVRTMMNVSGGAGRLKTNAGHVLTMSVTAVEGDWTDFHRRAYEAGIRPAGCTVRGIRVGRTADG